MLGSGAQEHDMDTQELHRGRLIDHLQRVVRDLAASRRFHQAAVAAGGRDNGKPGERPYQPGYYAAFVLDPDGNNIEVVFHGPAKRSAGSIHITF
jgi:hypothetical protein